LAHEGESAILDRIKKRGTYMSKRWITHSRIEGQASRQAHADLPEGTFERELGKEGFFGPASFMYHRQPPTGWSSMEGPLKPRAFDGTKIKSQPASPWDATLILHNAHCKMRIWRCPGSMPELVRNSDGDELLSTTAKVHFFATTAI
jgi:homogentisate 1,2-dioxygenase